MIDKPDHEGTGSLTNSTNISRKFNLSGINTILIENRIGLICIRSAHTWKNTPRSLWEEVLLTNTNFSRKLNLSALQYQQNADRYSAKVLKHSK